MPGKYIVLEPKYDTLLKGGVQFNDTGAVLVPCKDADGNTVYQRAGDVFPKSSAPTWTLPDNVGRTTWNEPVLDPKADAAEIQKQLQQKAEIDAMAAKGALGYLCPGGTYRWKVYCRYWYFDSNPPSRCKKRMPVNDPPYWGDWLLYDYYSTEVPEIGVRLVQGGGACMGSFLEGECITNLPLGTDPKDPLYTNNGQIFKLHFICAGQDCPGSEGGFKTLMPVNPPVAINLPDNVDMPTVVHTAPAPTLYGGVVTNVGSNPGTVTLTPRPGGYSMDLGVPCPCTDGKDGADGAPGPAGADGAKGDKGDKGDDAKVPEFRIGKVEVVAEKDAYVRLRGGPDIYYFDFGLPEAVMKLVEKMITLSIFDFDLKTASVQNRRVWVPADEEHDMGGVVDAFLHQIAEIRNGLPVAKSVGQGTSGGKGEW